MPRAQEPKTEEPEAAEEAPAEEPEVDSVLAALEEEKRGYAVRGLDERVKQVDAAIKAHQKAAD